MIVLIHFIISRNLSPWYLLYYSYTAGDEDLIQFFFFQLNQTFFWTLKNNPAFLAFYLKFIYGQKYL